MVIHYPPARLRRINSDQPTAITDVLITGSGSSSRIGDLPLGPDLFGPQPPGPLGAVPHGDQVVVVLPGVPWSDLRSRSPKSWIVWATARMTWTAPPSGRSGSFDRPRRRRRRPVVGHPGKDVVGPCCIWPVRGMLKRDADYSQIAKASSSNATANCRFTGSSTASL